MLCGRTAELAALDELVATVRAGGSASLVLRGEPGIGKTALLDHAAAAPGVRVLRAAGVESEAALPFAGLHLLLRPALDRVAELPAVQAAALRGALGLAPATDSDGFLVGLAALSLLAELAADQPLLVLVDDAHWLDRESAEALLFAARRLDADGVGIVFAARDAPGLAAPGLAELRLTALPDEAADELLTATAAGLDPAARRQILADAAGNPLALLELPATLDPPGRTDAVPDRPRTDGSRPGGSQAGGPQAGGYWGGGGSSVRPGPRLTERLHQAFRARLYGLPQPVRDLLLVAALDDSGELAVLLPAVREFGAGVDELDAAVRAGVLTVTEPHGRVAFRHPLVRATVAQDAPPGRRIAAHTALAAALDTPGGADRRAWHLAAATTGPDERVAAALEDAAARAAERHGHAASAAAYRRAAELSTAADTRLRRLTLAAEAAAEAGQLDQAVRLATEAPPPDDPRLAARLVGVRASASFWRGTLPAAHEAFLRAADLLADDDPVGATAMLVEALHVGWYTGERELTEAYDRLAATLAAEPRNAAGSDGEATAMGRLTLLATAPAIDRAAPDGVPPDEAMATVRRLLVRPGWQVMTAALGILLGQDGATIDIGAEQAARAYRQGRIGLLPQALFYLGSTRAFAGWHVEADRDVATAVDLAHATDQRQWAGRLREPQAYLAAIAGDEPRVRQVTDEALADAAAADPYWEVPWVHWSLGLLELGLGRAESALAELAALDAQRALFHIPAIRSVPDLVEAAVRAGQPEAAADALGHYRRWARHTGQGWTAALVRRCAALLADDAAAEPHYRAALSGSQRANRPFELARTALLYGEWLRRMRRRTEARQQLQTAVRIFDRSAAGPWAERARTELAAAGERTDPAPADALVVLTPQERQIVQLAAQGLSNKDIAGRLFLSPRTVGYHLYKAYPKLGVLSRGELPAIVGSG